MTTKSLKPRIITRWERIVPPSDPSETWGRLEISLIEPERNKGWNMCAVDVSGLLKYVAIEVW